jgi:hypothetical protein
MLIQLELLGIEDMIIKEKLRNKKDLEMQQLKIKTFLMLMNMKN